ncbi:hypothetical protein F511_28722 [Dorcoceras hygrometricum]|uniref:Splicing factor 3B subunit 1-like n=1 Tax=Dorcoceras hygrometricum TaxID=472368 RepID=A0A2Z7CMF5_9LAMI|nr:hypothetical protein F511_28722 [Dorcoceras hygrometricum]
MASIFITNALQVNFESVLGISDNDGMANTFPPLKILSEKTVNTYVATNNTTDACGESDEPHVDKVAIIKRKSVSKNKSAPTDKKNANEELVEVVEKAVSKNRSASTSDEPAVTNKKRTTKKKSALSKANLELVSEPAVEEIFEKEQEESTADDVDQIIARIIIETTEMETEEMFVETDAGKSYETAEAIGTDVTTEIDVEKEKDMDTELVETEQKQDSETKANKEPVVAKANEEEMSKETMLTKFLSTDEESMKIDHLLKQIPDDMMLPSVTAAEPTKIKFGFEVQIKGVQDGAWYYASLPNISAKDKGKKPLESPDMVKGHPIRPERCLSQIADLASVKEIAAKEKHMLIWAETNSLETAKKEHNLMWERPCSTKFLDKSADTSGAVLAQFYSQAKSTCWSGAEIISTNPIAQTQAEINSLEPIVQIETDSIPADPILQLPDSGVNFSSPHDSSESRLHFDSADIPLDDATADDQSSMPPVTDFIEAFAQLRSSINHMQFEQIRQKDDGEHLKDMILTEIRSLEKKLTEMLATADDQSSMPPVTDFIEAFAQLRSSINHMQFEQIRQKDDGEHLKDMILTEIRSLEKKLTEMLEQQDIFYRGLFKTVRQEIQIQKTALSFELLEFKKAVGAQNAFLISNVTDIRSHTKEIQALKTDFTNFQQRSEEGISHVSDQLFEIIAYINRGGIDKKGESSSHGPQPPPNDRDRIGSGGNGGRIRGGRSESSKRRYDSSGGPRKRSAEYWFGGK